MLEILLIVTFIGVLLASLPTVGFGNPFQIYFSVWFLVVLGYYSSADTYIPISSEFALSILAVQCFSFAILIGAISQYPKPGRSIRFVTIIKERGNLILFFQMAVTVGIPFVYLRAISLSGGDDIFTVVGYVNLRSAMTREGEGYGLLDYFTIPAYVLSSLAALFYRYRKVGLLYVIWSFCTSLFYSYLSTGRTSLLLLLCLVSIPFVVLGIIRTKGILLSLSIFAALFVFIAGMTAKGVSADDGLIANVDSFLENIRSYSVAPLLAFSKLMASDRALDWGVNTFRFFISLQYALGLSDIQPPALIRDFVSVPDLTNVYTVYEVYFLDFAYIGLFIPPAFLILHYWLYRKAVGIGGAWIFYYSASIYPLAMQFFQDQYFSLLSSWIQIAFWYWLFLTPGESRLSGWRPNHA